MKPSATIKLGPDHELYVEANVGRLLIEEDGPTAVLITVKSDEQPPLLEKPEIDRIWRKYDLTPSALNRIISRHTPEFDVAPEGPSVTWAEADLAHTLQAALERIDALEEQVKILAVVTDDQTPF